MRTVEILYIYVTCSLRGGAIKSKVRKGRGFTNIGRKVHVLITPRKTGKKNTIKEYGKSITGSSIIKIILGKLFEGFLNSILSVLGFKSEGRCPFFNNEVSVIFDKFSS